jgi:hypothetical protein
MYPGLAGIERNLHAARADSDMPALLAFSSVARVEGRTKSVLAGYMMQIDR